MNPFRKETLLPVHGGSMVIDGKIVPIVGATLENGLLSFVAHLDACPFDLELRDGQEFRIHGSDGSEIAVCRWTVNRGKPLRTLVGQQLTVVFPMKFEKVIGGGER